MAQAKTLTTREPRKILDSLRANRYPGRNRREMLLAALAIPDRPHRENIVKLDTLDSRTI